MSPQSVTCICEVIFPRSVLSQGGDSPEQHGDYWEAVSQFVLQDSVDQASNLLRLHSEFTMHGPVHHAWTRSPRSTSCCARCRFAAQPPLQLSLNSVGSLGKLR